ncbi:MAG TPA: aspartate 1-decarboxylase [Candidatus Omnitrophota bacterium]|nr:aspartate 1-decarboxylase [Candidatus Omnitrophota bacterium]
MQRQLLSGKIHRVTVTEARIDYEGSVTIDSALMKNAGILPFEKVLIANLNNGSRIESYAIAAPAGSGVICLNGGAAKHGRPGDTLIIMTFGIYTAKEVKGHKPKVVYVDKKNHIVKKK